MDRKELLFVPVFVVLCLCGGPNALGLEGQMLCESGGTFFTNLGASPINFDLSADSVTGGTGCAFFTFSWTDANGHPQTLTIGGPAGQESEGVSSSLPAGGVISWTASGRRGIPIRWQFERPAAMLLVPAAGAGARRTAGSATFGSVGGNMETACGSKGTLYTNLTPSAINFDLGLHNRGGVVDCNITASWTDANGHPQKITLSGTGLSQGVSSTSLPADGAISWTSSGSNPGFVFHWQLERAPVLTREPPEEKEDEYP